MAQITFESFSQTNYLQQQSNFNVKRMKNDHENQN